MKRFTLKPLKFFTCVLAAEGLDRGARSSLFDDGGNGAAVPDFPADFLRDLRFLRELDLAANPHHDLCVRYCESVYSSGRRDLLFGRARDRWISGEDFFKEVSSFRYYQRFFLEPGRLPWERLQGTGPGRNLPPPGAFDLGKDLLSYIVSAPRPLRFSALAGTFSGRPVAELADAFFTCLHTAAAVLIWNKDLEVLEAGAWPHLWGSLRADWMAAVKLEARGGPLQAVPPSFPPYCIGDMESALIYAAFFGIKMRKGRYELHKKDRKGICEEWQDCPAAGLRIGGRISRENRLEEVFSFLRSRDFILPEEGGKFHRFKIGRKGMDWLRLSFSEKFSFIAEEKKRVLALSAEPADKAVNTVAELLCGGGTFDAEDFLTFAVYRRNPLLSGGGYTYGTAVKCWQKALETVVFSYLLPLGGLALTPEDDRVLFSLTPAGRFLLGISQDVPPLQLAVPVPYIGLSADGRILVRTPGKTLDDKLSRFCDKEDRENDEGPAYRVTGPSVLRAAAAGIPLEVLLYVLQSLSFRKVPDALEKAVCRRYRTVGQASILPGFLVECGAPKWAKKIAAADPLHIRAAAGRFILVDETLGMEDFSALCRRAGVLLTDLRNPGSRNNPGPFPPV